MGTRGLRVLHLGFEDPQMPGAGGGSVRTEEINRRLVAEGMRVTVLTTRYPRCRARRQEGVDYVPIGPWGGGNRLTRLAGYMAALPGVVHRHAADVDLVVEDFFAPISTMAAPLWTGLPTIGIVQWLHARAKATEYGLPFHVVERFGVRAHRRLIAVSHGTANHLRVLNPRIEVSVIGNGVDPTAFAPPTRLGKDVLFVGRLETRGKGVDLLLRAWALAAPRLSADLVIVGSGPDEAEIHRLAHSLAIDHRVRFAGWLSGATKFTEMASARLVVVPSREETFGLVAVEALAAGTPVVAFDIPCLRELVPPAVGELVPAFDVAALAERLVATYGNVARVRRMGTAGRRMAASYDWDVLATLQARIYHEAVQTSATHVGNRSPLLGG